MKDFPSEKYLWNEWAVYVVSTLKGQSEDLNKQRVEISDIKTEISLLKSLDIRNHIKDYTIFKTSILTKVKMISILISLGIAILSLIIQIIILLKAN